MITIAEMIERYVAESPFLEEGIADGIINLSALARKLKPRVEKALMKSVTESALIMALKRLSPKIEERVIKERKGALELGDITVRSDLSEFTFARSDTLLEKQKRLFHRVDELMSPFITVTQGVFEITAIVNSGLETIVREVFEGEKQVAYLNGLAAVTIRLKPSTVHTPGVHYSILKQLAWRSINVVEVVSTYTELTIILEKSQVDVSFSILMKYLSGS